MKSDKIHAHHGPLGLSIARKSGAAIFFIIWYFSASVGNVKDHVSYI